MRYHNSSKAKLLSNLCGEACLIGRLWKSKRTGQLLIAYTAVDHQIPVGALNDTIEAVGLVFKGRLARWLETWQR